MRHQTQTLGLDRSKLRSMAPWTLLNQVLAGAIGLMVFGWVGLMSGELLAQIVGLLLALRIKPIPAAHWQEAARFPVADALLLPIGVLLYHANA